MLLPSLGLEIEAEPGDMIFFNSYGLLHGNSPIVKGGHRYSIVLFVHHNEFQLSEAFKHYKRLKATNSYDDTKGFKLSNGVNANPSVNINSLNLSRIEDVQEFVRNLKDSDRYSCVFKPSE